MPIKLKETITQRLKRISRNLSDKNIREEFVGWAEEVVKEQKSDAPVLTGKLRDSITVKKHGTGVNIEAGVEYAIHLEFGTAKMPPQPFFYPAIQRNLNKLYRRLARQMKK